MIQTINHKIRRGFSATARQYDLFSSLHRGIADRLWGLVINGPTPTTILDLGCGTGYLTLRAQGHFPKAKVIGLDFAKEMLDVACSKHNGIGWVLGDINDLPFSDGQFDVLISNLAYQWAGGMARAFGEARRVLSREGVLACTLFGHNTCQELFQSLDEAKAGALRFSRLPDEFQIREALEETGFKSPQVDIERVKIEFKDMQELIAWLKSIGANHLPREGYVGKETMARAAAIYRERFACHNGIQATFEVIRVYVKK